LASIAKPNDWEGIKVKLDGQENRESSEVGGWEEGEGLGFKPK